MKERLERAAAIVQALLDTNYYLTFQQAEEPSDDLLITSRTMRGKDDPKSFLIEWTKAAEAESDEELVEDVYHELLHVIGWEHSEKGEYRLRPAERAELRAAWERSIYELERATWPYVHHWTLPWYRRILRTPRAR